MKKSNLTLRALTEGAIFVAAAQVLSMLKLWEMPWGGSVTLAMIPLFVYAVRWGLGPGLLAGFVFGVLQFTFDGGFAIGASSARSRAFWCTTSSARRYGPNTCRRNFSA